MKEKKRLLVEDDGKLVGIISLSDILNNMNNKAARIIKKVLISAVANAENNHNLDKAKLYVKEAYVNDGPVLKRSVPDSRGRIAKNDHRTSHVTVVVAER